MIPGSTTKRPRGRLLAVFLALLLPGHFAGSSAVLAQSAATCPAPESLVQGFQGPMIHVRYLADDALEGREVGSPGERCAGDYIAAYFRNLGLTGAAPDGSFFQSFEVPMGAILGGENSLRISDLPVLLREEWIPFGFSPSGRVTAPLVYGGSGVGRPGSENDPHAQLGLEGMIVVVEASDPHGPGMTSMAGDPHFKASTAARLGAAAVLVLLKDGTPLPDMTRERRPTVRVPAAAISGIAAEKVREAARAGWQADLSVTVQPRMVEARNVAAKIPGADPTLADQVIIVGAHYDHLGFGEEGSLAPDSRTVHNGADDNASGTAAMMEVAARMMGAAERPSRTILFLAFTGEEKGLWGSGHYVKEPLLPLENTVAMINMDMVGRLRDNTLTVYGTGTAQEWPALLEHLNARQPEPFVISPIPDGFGPSDHSSFYGGSVPVLHFFTNTHAEYHRPEDEWHLIDGPGLERVTALVEDVSWELAGEGTRTAVALTLVEGAGPPPARPEAGDPSAAQGYGAYMGTIPDMTPQEFGVRITGVREGSPAEHGGLLAGDVIVALGEHDISDLYAYTYALRDHKPGDAVTVEVLRGGERLRFMVVLGLRR
jgi:aminopeptidase YwaD